MAAGFYLTNAVILGMLNATGMATSFDAGTACVIEIYSGAVPADADAAEAGTLLATLTCTATTFASFVDQASPPAGVATFNAITSGAAGNTGTASHFRIKTQAGGTVVAQGTVGTSAADLILNTTAITSGSTVSITAATITLPEGP